MSLASIFKNVIDRIVARSRKEQLEHLRNDGGSLGSTPASSGGAFDPIKREAPAPRPGEQPPPPGDAGTPDS